MQQKVTDITTKLSPYEPQKDKLNKPKGVEAVTNEVTIGGPKLYVTGEKTIIDTLVSCDILSVVILFTLI